jgi:glycosyltransferase involved in cell wall biosynthesis
LTTPTIKSGEKNLRVAQVTTVDMAVGLLLRDQILYLQRAGWDVEAICSDGPWVPKIRASGIRVHTVRLRRAITPFRDIVGLARLYRCFKREKYLIVHTHTPKANLLGQIAAWLAGVPIRVITVHGFYFHDRMGRLARNFYIWLERISHRCAGFSFSQNREDIATARREKIGADRKMHFLGNGIDLALFNRELHADSARRLREELGIKAEAPVIGIVGRLTFEKGYREFVQAAAIVHRQFPEVHFIAIGPEDVMTFDSMRGLPGMEEIKDCFHWLGMQVDMPKFYAMMSAFVLPSYREGFPRALMEASAMALPVVATDIRGCREAVDHRETGILVPPRNVEPLAEAVLELLRNPEATRLMGEKGRAKAEREFDQLTVFRQVLSAYQELAGSTAEVVPRDGGG